MANLGPARLRLARKWNSSRPDPPDVPILNQGNRTWDTRHLGNQVVCMIAEYHLMSSARVSSTLSPVLPEAAKPLLPPLKSYVSNISFEDSQDVRVLDHAKAFRVAVWLHRLDMSIRGDEVASETLDASRHCLGCLLELFLIPATHGLSFREVVARCLYENWRDGQHQLDDLVTTAIEFVKNSMASWRPTGWPPEKPKSGPRRTWTFTAETSRASELASLMRSPISGRAPLKGTSQMTRHMEMQRPRCLPMLEPMTLPLRVPWLQPLALLLVRTLPCRLMRGLLVHLPPVLSLGMMMNSSPVISRLEWRWAWPTSPFCPPVDEMWKERKPHARRCLPLRRMSNCRTDDRSRVASREGAA